MGWVRNIFELNFCNRKKSSDFQFYKVPVYGENSNDILSESEFYEQFQSIVANKSTENVPIGLLSSQQRDALAKAYEELIKSMRAHHFRGNHFPLMF